MKATLTFFFCLILSWHLPGGVSFPALNEGSKQRAQELLDLSFKQNPENHELAIETAKDALALFKSIGDHEGIATTYEHLGTYYFALNRMRDAAQYYESALQIWRQQNDVANEAGMLIQLGYIEGRQGEWLNGFSYLTQAQNMIDNQENPGTMARIAAGMAQVFRESGLPENGLTQSERAKEYYRQAQEERSYNRQIMLIGYTQFLLNNYQTALTEMEDALRRFESSSDSRRELDASQCHEYMAQVYLATGKYDLALQHLLPPLRFNESKNKPDVAAQIRAWIGEVYQRQGKTELARTNYQAALNYFRAADTPVEKAAVAFGLGRLELNEGNYDVAENFLKESIETTENIRSDLNSRVLATAFSASVHDRYETYIDCLMRKHKQQPSQGLELQAFQASELARARSLTALLHDTQTKIVTGIDRQLAEQERTLRQAIRAKAEQTITLLAADYNKDQLHELETSLTRLREQHKQVVQKLQKQNPHYDQIKETTNYSVKQIQDLIIEDDQTMLLEYFVGRNASYLWAITRNDIKVFDLPKADEINRAVQDVYELLSVEPNDDTDKRLNKATAELSQLVLGPVANQLNARRLIVVADGALNYIPFQLLPIGRDQAPLVANYEVVNAPSASVLGQLRQERQQRPRRTKILAAFGDPVFAANYQQFKNSGSGELLATKADRGESWQRASRDIEIKGDDVDTSTIQPLHYSKSELKKLSDLAGSQALIAKGFDASRGVLETTDFSKYAILHFATHGLLNPKNPENSGFLLSMLDFDGKPQNGFITMQDVYGLHVPVDLVVLSACRTGLGKDVRGEGLIGLTRGFMHAGASSVVASLWKVDDEATAELMKNFYANMLQKGMAPAEALRTAQNTVRQNPQWQSPHFWAGFTLQGEFKESIKLPAPIGAPVRVQNSVGGGLLLALLGGIAWGFKRRLTTKALK